MAQHERPPHPERLDVSSINRDLLAPLLTTRPGYWAFVIALIGIVAAGAGAWTYQIQTGIGQTNLHKPIFWAVYIASFVFWIGASHSGTFIAGVLRLTHAEWRRPITRMAELMTVISLLIAGLFVFFHLGRVWRWYYLVPYPNQRELWPNFQSPLMWDATAVFTYATASAIYLYMPLIPDFALVRHRIRGWRQGIYRVLSLGWCGTQRQWHALETAMRILTPLIIMVMISASSIVGWDFGVSLVPAWDSTIFALYFVIGAIHSGLGLVVVGLYVLRRTYRLERYIQIEQFDKMGKLMLVATLLLGYVYFAEMITIWYGREPDHMHVLASLLSGAHAALFWPMLVLIYVIPLLVLPLPAFRRRPLGMMLLGVLINVGMYIERVIILVPPLAHPRLPYMWSTYFPSWVELTIMAGSLAFAVLLYVLAVKFIPIVSVWEEREGHQHG